MKIIKFLNTFCIVCSTSGLKHRTPYTTSEKAEAALVKMNKGLVHFVAQ
jgi:hypothetical protein